MTDHVVDRAADSIADTVHRLRAQQTIATWNWNSSWRTSIRPVFIWLPALECKHRSASS